MSALHESEIERLRIPVDAYLEIVEENTASYARTREVLAAGRPLPVEGTLEYAPQIIHCVLTGTPRMVYGNASVNDLLVRAATDGDPRHVRHAAMADPATAAALPVERVWNCAATPFGRTGSCCNRSCGRSSGTDGALRSEPDQQHAGVRGRVTPAPWTLGVPVDLKKGSNTVTFGNASVWAPNIDRIELGRVIG